MPKVKKVHRRKRYNANINRKRLRNKVQRIPEIKCKEIHDAWELSKSAQINMKEMALAYDPNKAIPIPNTKQEIIKSSLVKIIKKKDLKVKEKGKTKPEEAEAPKKFVAEALEADAKAPRQKLFRMPNSEVTFVTYMMDKYGEEYEAMEKDPKNHYQMTWKQIRSKINKFKKIPEQYGAYLEKKTQQSD